MSKGKTYYEKAACTWSEDSIRLIPTASATAKSLFFYVQEIGYFKTHIPYFTERKNLDSYLIIYTISGEGRLDYEGSRFSLTSGDAIFINCNISHHYETASKETWEFLWVHFNGIQALGYYQEFIKKGFHIMKVQDTFSIENTMWHLLSLYQKTDAATELITNSLITSLLTGFLLDTYTLSSESFQTPDFIKEARKYIDKHFREELSLDLLANTLGISKFHLSREFKKHMGIPLNEYIINNRISHAKTLLRFSSLSVQEIVYTCGMNNVSYFIRTFKEREGLTPHVYRRQWN